MQYGTPSCSRIYSGVSVLLLRVARAIFEFLVTTGCCYCWITRSFIHFMGTKQIKVVISKEEEINELVSNDTEFQALLEDHNVRYLIDAAKNATVRGYSSLVDGGRYKLGPRKRQEQQERKRKLELLQFYHKAVLETGTSKSVKLLRVRQLSGGAKRCFLCGCDGSPENKIEASHVLQNQDIYVTGGEDSLETLDILKDWANGLGWNRPFKIHDPMNLIWLCHTHKLAFASYKFGLCLGGLDNSIRFCSYSDEFTNLVDSANERLQDTSQPFFDMSYVSRRAVGMRIYKAQKNGYFLNHSDTDAWQAVVQLSNAASMYGNNDGDDE